MYLRASDKATGVANFHSAVGSTLIRRDLITKALHDGLAPRHGLEAVHFKYAKSLEKPLVAGVLGAGQQGLRLLAAVNPAFIAVRSIADIRPTNRSHAAAVVKSAHVHNSFEELIKAAKADGLEAVIIALPSHLHAPATLAALEAGLHVFVETPMALTVADAKKITRVAAEKGLCLAVGQQRRYNWIYDHALEMVRNDLLDQVHYVRSQWHMARPETKVAQSASGAESVKAEDASKSSKIDWWQEIPKQERDLKFDGYASPEELVRWRFYEKYSGGLLAELGSQLFDAAVLFVTTSPNHDPQRPYPISVAGSASQVLRDATGDINDHVHCVLEYAIEGYVDAKEIPPKARKKIALQFDMILGSDFDGYGETVLGRKGSLVLESEQRAMLFYMADVDKNLRIVPKKAAEKNAGEKPAVEKKESKGAPAIEVPKDGKTDEESEALGRLALLGADAGFATALEHWAYCCKPAADKKYSAENKPLCDAGAGLYNTVLTVAAAKALKSETRIDFKNEWFDFKSDETPDDL
ncbi:MAG: Gfo/Idh/MocA family protein [Thermoguttaceae bacterium]